MYVSIRMARPVWLAVALLSVLAGCNDTVAPDDDVVMSVEVSPASPVLEIGDTLMLRALAFSAAGDTVRGRPVVWESSDATVVVVNAEGRVRARAVGTSAITARIDGRPGRQTVTVTGTPVARIALSQNSVALRSSEYAHVVATPVDADEVALPDRELEWTTSDSSVALVAPDGYVRAVAPGTAVLTVRSEHVTASLPVAVSPFTDFHLVFERMAGSGRELFEVDLNGGAPVRLLAGIAATDVAASPDGAWLAFVLTGASAADGDLWVARRDGSALRRLTSAPGLEHRPAWSPDGSRIAFRADADGTGGDIWVIDASGGNAVNLTPESGPARSDECDPAWSHDGQLIAYTSTISGNADVWIMAADGSGRVRFTATAATESRPAWSPDGNWIAFAQRQTGGSADIAVVTTGGADVVRIVLAGDQLSPAWSPDSRMLAFASSHTGTSWIHALHMHAFDLVPLTSTQTGDHAPAWVRQP